MLAPSIRARLPHFIALTRLDRPIGILLLLWPTLWALWLAARGVPRLQLLAIFGIGVVLTRSAGCVVNDLVDRHLDAHVERTRTRPLVIGSVQPREALALAAALLAVAFALVLATNALTVALSVAALLLAVVYPYAKRFTQAPQAVLGAAFGAAIPMAYAATLGTVPAEGWLLFVANLFWTVAYDTFYAMVDRDDDRRVGIKSTAILFAGGDRVMIATLQALSLLTLALVGLNAGLGGVYYGALAVAAGLFAFELVLVRGRDRDQCLRAFRHNQFVGATVFAGIALDLAWR